MIARLPYEEALARTYQLTPDRMVRYETIVAKAMERLNASQS